MVTVLVLGVLSTSVLAAPAGAGPLDGSPTAGVAWPVSTAVGRAGAGRDREVLMGIADKAKNKLEEMTGKSKAAAGDATDNPDLQAEGKTEESSANAKQAGESVKDALRDAGNATKGDTGLQR